MQRQGWRLLGKNTESERGVKSYQRKKETRERDSKIYRKEVQSSIIDQLSTEVP